eukprot:2960454-Prymnesium_polylepis.1
MDGCAGTWSFGWTPYRTIRWSTRPAGGRSLRATAPAGRLGHAATRHTAVWRGVDDMVVRDLGPGYVVGGSRDHVSGRAE